MTAASPTSAPAISPDTPSATSSLALASGATPSEPLAGQMELPLGLAPVRVSRSQWRAKVRALKTRDTYGPTGFGSSASRDLTLSLASRLRAAVASHGSTLYRLTWKTRSTPSGRWIPAQRASAHRTSDNGSTGWPTVTAVEGRRHGYMDDGRPRAATNPRKTGPLTGHSGTTLSDAALLTLSGWVTPNARDWKDTPGMGTVRKDGRSKIDQLPRQAHQIVPPSDWSSGSTSNGSTAETASDVRFLLNPRFALWLQGLPDVWASCAARAMPSVPRKRRNSSRPSSTTSTTTKEPHEKDHQ